MEKTNKIQIATWFVLAVTSTAITIDDFKCWAENCKLQTVNQEYQNYFINAEALFDKIEEDNESYFDGSLGAQHIKSRNIIINRKNSTK